MIEDMDDSIGKVEEKNNRVESLSPNTTGVSSTTPPLVQPSHSNQVVRRVWHTRTEFTFYPGGQVYPGKPSGWFEDKIYQVKKKPPKKNITADYKKSKEVIEI